jgi:FkbM family methyltransferase
MKVYIQVGANVGNDDFFRMCQKLNEKSKIIIVEPISELIEDLKICYKDLSEIHDIIFLNCGVVTEKNSNNNIMTLFLPKNHTYEDFKRYSSFSSFVNRKTIQNLEKKQIEVKTKTFEEIFNEYKIEKVEELHLDTEGYCYELVLSIDLNKFDIKKIYFELQIHSSDDLNNTIDTGPHLLPLIEQKYVDYQKEIVYMEGMETHFFFKN